MGGGNALRSAGYVWVLNDDDDFMDVYLSPNSSCIIHEIFLHINHTWIKYFERMFQKVSDLEKKPRLQILPCELFWNLILLDFICTIVYMFLKKKKKKQTMVPFV